MAKEKSMVGDVYYPAPQVIASAYVPNVDQVNNAARANLSSFWRKIATENFEWYQPWATVLDDSNAPFYSWFSGAKVNIVHNALDRHMRTEVRNRAALIFEGEPGDSRVYTYRQLNHEVSKFASVLRSMGVSKGDPVAIFMGRIPEQIIAMLACAKIGAVHAVVQVSASVDALARRIDDSGAKMLITCDGAWSRGNIVELKQIVDDALVYEGPVQSVICVRRTGQEVKLLPGRDYWYHDLMNLSIADPKALTEFMDAEDPLLMLYSADPEDQPKAVVHTHGGYMVGTGTTLKWVFDIKPADVWWCTADPSAIVGHSYVVYGPLLVGATSFIYEGVPTYPYPDRWWQLVARYSVTVMYASPSIIRDLMRFGESWPARHDLTSLRLLGTSGGSIHPEAWKWFYRVIGREQCPIMDTWLQRETGSIVISPLPSVPLKPGSAALPLPGIQVEVVDENGETRFPNVEGHLVIKNPWPAMLRAIHGDTDRYVDKYWSRFTDQGYFLTGDRAIRDEDGYIWICRSE